MSTALHPRILAELLRVNTDYFNVYVVTHADGVVLPASLYPLNEVILAIGDRMARAIPDLEFDDWGCSATLVFGGEPFKVVVPWHAVRALATVENEIAVVWNQLAEPLCAPPAPTPTKSHLKVVK